MGFVEMETRNSILIVDDAELNREMLSVILEEEYVVLEAENGRDAFAVLEEKHDNIAAVLLDLNMPEMDGFKVMENMKAKGWMNKIPVLIISGETAIKTEKECFEYGVSDFIRKPFDNTLVKKRVNNIVKLFLYQNELEKKVEKQTEIVKRQYNMLQMQAQKLQKSNENIIDILGTVVENRNLESGEHIKRVKGFTAILARELMKEYPEYGLTEKKIEMIVSTSSLHDVGKISIPDNVLLKPGKLTAEEYEYMKSHTTRGSEILSEFKDIWDDEYRKTSYEICRYHHERYDGRGYPDGLKGDEIPISAQIVSIADVYDALVSERVYKSAYTKDEAFHMIVTGECGVFSPKLLECFRNVKKEFEAL
jgi:putative two-component system response regulator